MDCHIFYYALVGYRSMQFPPATEVAGKVMFSLVGVCLSTGGGSIHVTIARDALDLTVQAALPIPLPWPPRH